MRTLEIASANGGAMTARERWRLAPAVALGQARFLRDRLFWALGVKRRAKVDPTWPGAPDSALCGRVEEEATTVQSEPMLQHGRRTWALGSMLAEVDAVTLDAELFYSAALMHDAGLEKSVADECFTLRSADAFLRATAIKGDADVTGAADAIVRHISPGLDPQQSTLAYYLQAGATADLAAMRLWELPRDLVARTMAAYPRGDIGARIQKCFSAEAKAVPQGRAHYVARYGRFVEAVGIAPKHGG